ncbi:WAT1-related protein At5g40210 isoform X2 [Ziziphus jujuba]|uniref:WAT1-related protein At5g40210 isoform X2 n=1 Tax=Ziziphus jujuba TaxID=326968 RepID=A0ABM3ZXT8_ZIZJJ|nr:WAT1-related protein At5g40210 isoform X2 [Ziziphus jujuba]
MITVAFCCFFVSMEISLVSLIIIKDPNAWRLQFDVTLVAVLFSGIGNAFRGGVITWCLKRKGPSYVSIFKPLALVIADVVDVTFLGEGLYFGSLVGGVVIVAGFYAVMWGKAKEEKSLKNTDKVECLDSSDESSPLLQNRQ